MKKHPCLMILTVGLMVVITSAYSSKFQVDSTTAEFAIDRRVSTTDLESVTTVDALTTTLRKAKIPGGIVIAPTCAELPKRTVKPLRTTVSGVLDAVALADPQYKWQFGNGVVNFAPKVDNAPLLNLRITKFKATDVETPREALNQLLDLPEVQAGMHQLRVGPQLFRGGLGFYHPENSDSEDVKKFTVECESCTFQESLNAIVRAHGTAVWSYLQNDCGSGSLVSIDFLVQ